MEKSSPKMLQNTVRKGEIARHSVFKRLVLQIRKNQGLFGKGLTLKAPSNIRLSVRPV